MSIFHTLRDHLAEPRQVTVAAEDLPEVLAVRADELEARRRTRTHGRTSSSLVTRDRRLAEARDALYRAAGDLRQERITPEQAVSISNRAAPDAPAIVLDTKEPL